MSGLVWNCGSDLDPLLSCLYIWDVSNKKVLAQGTYIFRVHICQGNGKEILFFSRSGNCQGILRCIREKYNFAKMSEKCQGILHFSLMKVGYLVLLYSSC